MTAFKNLLSVHFKPLMIFMTIGGGKLCTWTFNCTIEVFDLQKNANGEIPLVSRITAEMRTSVSYFPHVGKWPILSMETDGDSLVWMHR